jgi:hypothetical protein
MTRLHESQYIFGMHDPGGEKQMDEMGRKGWVLFTEAIGSDPNAMEGGNYTHWSNEGYGIIVRLNNGYHPDGTIPHPTLYEAFARRCGNFVRASRGAHIWIIGNEMNYQIEWPRGHGAHRDVLAPRTATPPADQDELRASPGRFSALSPDLVETRSGHSGDPITPEKYARCYRLCRQEIRRQPGHENDQVLIGSVAPWNVDTRYEGNPSGDWVQYLTDLLVRLGPNECDGITIHTYTHGTDPALIHDAAKMNPPFQNRHYHFFTYRDFMGAIPANMRHLPVYLTEMDQDDPWEDANRGWVKRAYGEINWWNSQPGNQQIRAAILYRWPRYDRWYIEGKNGVITDFREAMQNDYRWKPSAAPVPDGAVHSGPFTPGETLFTLKSVRLRRTPGFQNKGPDDVIVDLPLDARLTVVSGPTSVDGLRWWQVRGQVASAEVTGWVAQSSFEGSNLLASLKSSTGTSTPAGGGKFQRGSRLFTTTFVNLRHTPGYVGKTADDIAVEIPYGQPLTVEDGAQRVDDLTWWRVSYTSPEQQKFGGWAAESSPSGQELLSPQAPPLPKPIEPPPFKTYTVGDAVCNISLSVVNLRKSPGHRNKATDDVIAHLPSKALLRLQEGPREADGLHWWRVQGQVDGNPLEGWMAEVSPTGVRLLAPAIYRDAIRLAVPFHGNHRVSQLWGSHASFYSQFKHDGVPLRGHNGIDFAMPVGTPLLATDSGTVIEVASSPRGFGNWVMIDHRWGQSVYAHMHRITVRHGQSVQRGDVLGESGNTGTSTGPHLHYSIRINPYFRGDGWGGYCDPLPFMDPAQLNIPPSMRGVEDESTLFPPSPLPVEEPGYRLP